MGTFIVGFSGKARSGKNSLAAMLRAVAISEQMQSPYPDEAKFNAHLIQNYALAGALKSWLRVQGWMDQKDSNVLQVVGTDILRARDPAIWIKTLMLRIAEDAAPMALITDVRFRNEFAWVKSTGGLMIRVEKFDAASRLMTAADRDAQHQSEWDLDAAPHDYTVDATEGDMKELWRCAERLWEHVKGRLK